MGRWPQTVHYRPTIWPWVCTALYFVVGAGGWVASRVPEHLARVRIESNRLQKHTTQPTWKNDKRPKGKTRTVLEHLGGVELFDPEGPRFREGPSSANAEEAEPPERRS